MLAQYDTEVQKIEDKYTQVLCGVVGVWAAGWQI